MVFPKIAHHSKHWDICTTWLQEQMQDVLDAMFERKVEPNEYVIKQGDDGDNFYVIERWEKTLVCTWLQTFLTDPYMYCSGTYLTFVKGENDAEPRQVYKYENSGSFGELALMYNMPRAATIQAASSGSLWAMDRQTFRRILLKSAFRKRKMYESLIESVPMLKALEVMSYLLFCMEFYCVFLILLALVT
jgi:cAMP-dependent protein kinase regulator